MGTTRSRLELWLSLTALVLSVGATVTSVHFSQASLRTTVLPTLVFVYAADSGWALNNVGSGPALNVLLADEPAAGTGWQNPTRLYPIPLGGRVRLPWVGHQAERLGVKYTDAHGRPYTSVVDDDLTVIDRGDRLPGRAAH